MASFQIQVNGQRRTVQADADSPLLYVLRDQMELHGPKFGCGLGQCGACTVIVGEHAVTSCDTPMWSVAGKRVTTLEGLGSRDAPHPLQTAFIEEQALQCGYCTSGILMRAAALLARDPHPSEADIRAALEGNLCRCGVHDRVVRAVRKAAA